MQLVSHIQLLIRLIPICLLIAGCEPPRPADIQVQLDGYTVGKTKTPVAATAIDLVLKEPLPTEIRIHSCSADARAANLQRELKPRFNGKVSFLSLGQASCPVLPSHPLVTAAKERMKTNTQTRMEVNDLVRPYFVEGSPLGDAEKLCRDATGLWLPPETKSGDDWYGCVRDVTISWAQPAELRILVRHHDGKITRSSAFVQFRGS